MEPISIHSRPKLITEKVMHYCPGCSHGTIHNLIAEVIDEMNISGRTIGVAPVGCAVFAYDYIDIDWIQAAHGRACAVATGVSRTMSENIVFTYQGDGDLAAIGIAETIHAAARGESIVVIYVNNAIYGMTGGQMAPTTPLGMRSSTTPAGRNAELNGYPFKVADMVALLDGAGYVTRQSVHSAAAVRKCKRAIRKAFECAKSKSGLSLVEIIATCSSGWKMSPIAANDYVANNLIPLYPIGDIKNI